jgi:hypothetical protein
MTTTSKPKQPPARFFQATRGIENSEKRHKAGAILGEKDLAYFSEASVKNWIARGVLIPAPKPQEVNDGT